MKVNTELCVDLKTKLQDDAIMKMGKGYQGILMRDIPSVDNGFDYDHFTFTETCATRCNKRNPRVFEGKYITVTLKDDGTLRTNFRPLRTGRGFNVNAYAVGVCRELQKALKGLVGEE